jgi:hypothetical protein
MESLLDICLMRRYSISVMCINQAQLLRFLFKTLLLFMLFILGCGNSDLSQESTISHQAYQGVLTCKSLPSKNQSRNHLRNQAGHQPIHLPVQSRILDGQLVTAENSFSRSSANLQISVKGRQKNCSAVFLNSTTILTAAHCVDGIQPDQVTIAVGNQIACPAENVPTKIFFKTKEIFIHPDFQNNFSFDASSNLFRKTIADLAVVKFDKIAEPPFQIQFVQLSGGGLQNIFQHSLQYNLQNPAAAENVVETPQVLTVVGYGLHFQDISGQATYSLNLRMGNVAVMNNQELAVYDQPIREFLKNRVAMGTATSKEAADLNVILAFQPLFVTNTDSDKIFLQQSNGQGICLGDSGGGAFYLNPQTFEYELIGIHSSVFNWMDAARPCSRLGIITSVSKYRDWINQLAQ